MALDLLGLALTQWILLSPSIYYDKSMICVFTK
jgi:hypothetical protein